MSQLLSDAVNALPESKSATELRNLIQALGIEGTLPSLPASMTPGEFQGLMAGFLEKPIGDLSTAEIHVLAREVSGANKAIEPSLLPNGYVTVINDHTFTYRVAGPTISQAQEAYIRERLGSGAKTLLDGLKSIGVDVFVDVPKLSEATLDTKSAGKTRSDQIAYYEGELVDALQATNIAIEAVRAANGIGLDLRTGSNETLQEKGARIKAEALKGGLGQGTATLLEKLAAGVVRIGGGSGLGVLYIDAVDRDCRLHAIGFTDRKDPRFVAFGVRPAPESRW